MIRDSIRDTMKKRERAHFQTPPPPSPASLWNNNIGLKGACEFVEALHTNTTLTVLE